MVYIREAHAADSVWPMPVPDETAVNAPKSYDERTKVAGKCMGKLKIDMPCLIDDMENTVDKAYDGWPDRIYVVDTDGKIAVRAKRGPWGFEPGVKATAKWLAERFPDKDKEPRHAEPDEP